MSILTNSNYDVRKHLRPWEEFDDPRITADKIANLYIFCLDGKEPLIEITELELLTRLPDCDLSKGVYEVLRSFQRDTKGSINI